MTATADLLLLHRRLLEAARHATNLVGPGPLDEHYDDATEALTGLEPGGRWADLGSGAGFPGIVFAAMFPEVAVDLVENRAKRVAFLKAVLAAAEAELPPRPAPLRVVGHRLERLAAASYDGLLARALARPPVVLEHARRLLVPRGRVVLFLQQDADLPAAPGFELERVRPYSVGDKQRKSAVLRRHG